MTIFLGNTFKIVKGEVLAEVHSSAPSDYDLHTHWTEGEKDTFSLVVKLTEYEV